ncbi:nitronate monooxygenase [Pseudarthrobacter sp. CC12]|uniref:NAD(P)H-dependent flavin oxidoreductase n=1 Tax=Pseudarthrobacter sp. CC12 TaxID=3029193 RepID=UPI0032659DDE
MSITTRLTRMFGIEHPVVLAPMDDVADARLAGAVSSAGGLGLLGGGYGKLQWVKDQFARVQPGTVGCGFITWSLAQQPELLDEALAHRPKAVFLSFGDASPFVERIHAAGAKLICQVHDVEQARKAIDLGADALSAQGGEAGGHGLGTRSTFTLVPDVADLIAKTAPETVLLAAGGVTDGRHLAAALTLGADGVLVGTRFCATYEAEASERLKSAVVAASGDDTVRSSIYDIVREKAWPAEYTGRVLRNAFTGRWHGHEPELTAALKTTQSEYFSAVDAQDFSIAQVVLGEGVGQIHDIQHAAEVVKHMVRTAEARLGTASAAL